MEGVEKKEAFPRVDLQRTTYLSVRACFGLVWLSRRFVDQFVAGEGFGGVISSESAFWLLRGDFEGRNSFGDGFGSGLGFIGKWASR